MLSFRYHVVSIVAVFLALAIGVIMGSTVIDRVLVDRLEGQQETLRTNIDEVQGENEELRQELGSLRETLAENSGRLVDDALDGVPVVLLGVEGNEPEGWEELPDLVTAAGGDLRGQIWLTSRFALEADDDIADLAEAMGEDRDLRASAVRSLALARLATELRAAAGGDVSGSPSTPAPGTDQEPGAEETVEGAEEEGDDEPPLTESEATFVEQLREAGFLRVEGVGAEPIVVPGSRAVLISEPASGVAARLATELVTMGRPMAPLPLVAATTTAVDEEGADQELEIRSLSALDGELSTVDHLDRVFGRVATVFAVEDLGRGETGHYGTGPGATSVLPPPVDEPEPEE